MMEKFIHYEKAKLGSKTILDVPLRPDEKLIAMRVIDSATSQPFEIQYQYDDKAALLTIIHGEGRIIDADVMLTIQAPDEQERIDLVD